MRILHTHFELDRAAVLRRAAHALRVGGHLLVVDHGDVAPRMWVASSTRDTTIRTQALFDHPSTTLVSRSTGTPTVAS